MTAEKMFEKLGWEKIIKPGEIEYKKECQDEVSYIFICFPFEEKKPYIYGSCYEGENSVVMFFDKKLLNAINKQLKELGW